jgi:hypothetical protein
MFEEQTEAILEPEETLIRQIHVVYECGLHATTWVDVDHLLCRPRSLELIARAIGSHFYRCPHVPSLQTVVAPSLELWPLAAAVAAYLMRLEERTVWAVHAEHDCFGELVFRHGFDEFVARADVLVLSGLLLDGEDTAECQALIRHYEGRIQGLGSIFYHHGAMVGSAMHPMGNCYFMKGVDFPLYREEDCPLCEHNVAVNTEHGYGERFNIRRQKPLLPQG